VIDDLWNEDDWHSISGSLPHNNFGSRVLTITRFNDIANLCCSGCEESTYEVQHLGWQDSRELFFKELVGHDQVNYPNAPVDVFDDMLKMCGGTPATIISVALLLAAKATAAKSWHEMMNSIHSAWEKNSSSMFRFADWRDMLSLTYEHLSSTRKNCLLYLAVQAKNEMIHRTTTVRKWIAEGFIPEYVGCSREEVASRYFDELIGRNFIQLAEHGNFLGEEIYEANYMLINALRMMSHREDLATIWHDEKF
jgi:disease resistance protein RPM1